MSGMFIESFDRLQELSSQVNSYAITSMAEVELSDEVFRIYSEQHSNVENIEATRNRVFTNTAYGRDGYVKIDQEEKTNIAEPVTQLPSTWFIEPDKLVYVKRNIAVVDMLSSAQEQWTWSCGDSLLWSYSFLGDDIGSSGLPVITPNRLSNKQFWRKAFESAIDVSPKKSGNGSIVLRFKKPSGSFEVNFTPRELAGQEILIPSSVVMKDKVENILCDFQTLRWDDKFGPLPVAAQFLERRWTSTESGKTEVATTWKWSITSAKMGKNVVEQSSFAFDPMAYEKIFDADEQVFIKIPH